MGFTNPRTTGANGGPVTSITTGSITTSVGDLVILVGHVFSVGPAATPFTDSNTNTWTQISGLNPFSDATENVKVTVAYSILTAAGVGHTFTYTIAASESPSMSVLAVTPSATPTLNASGTGSGRVASSTTHTGATGTPSAGDLLFASFDHTGANISITAGGSWTLGDTEPNGNSYLPSGSEYQLSAAGGSTTDSFTTGAAAASADVICAFSISGGGPTSHLLSCCGAGG